MKVEDIYNTIVKTGILEYGDREYRTFICKSDVFPGTGDYEDETEIREDKEIQCFCVLYENILVKNQINADGGYFSNLSDAIRVVENSFGFKKWDD